MNKQLWGGRFCNSLNELTEEFNASINVDMKMASEDVEGCIAHAKGLAKVGVITKEEKDQIVKGLEGILIDIKYNQIEWTTFDEDVHMNVERILTERIGEVGKKLHTGRSRNDQCAVDTRLYMKQSIKDTNEVLTKLCLTLTNLAEEHLDTYMPAYTHLQVAQPTTLAHYLMAYVDMFRRDIERFNDTYKRTDYSPLGSGACVGVPYPLDREYVAKELGFKHITTNSLDAVSDRDYLIEYLANASICMMHASRLCEELILFSSKEFSYVTISDEYTTGSSIMPQKKNPDMAELIRGKTGRVYGSLITLLTIMKGLPLSYNKDMQEDKESVFDTVDTLISSLKILDGMMAHTTYHKDKLKNGVKQGFTNATDVADYLVNKGLPFRSAHKIVGELVCYAEINDLAIEQIELSKLQTFSKLFAEDIYEDISLETCVDKKNIIGGPNKNMVLNHIKQVKSELSN